MNFEPCNRHLRIKRSTQPDAGFIALPDDYKKGEKYEKVKILSISSNVKPPFSPGQEVIVLSHMIEEVDFGEGRIYLILENYVVGILKGE
jgi:hypothetical protein